MRILILFTSLAVILAACGPSWNPKDVLETETRVNLVLREPVITDSARTGTICGIVTDSVTHEPIVAATVYVYGTDTGAMAGVDGEFCISGLMVGEYWLKVSCVDFKSRAIESVVVKPGDTTRVRSALVEDENVYHGPIL